MWNLLLQSELNQKRNWSIDFDQIRRPPPARLPGPYVFWQLIHCQNTYGRLVLGKATTMFYYYIKDKFHSASKKLVIKIFLWGCLNPYIYKSFTCNCYKSKKHKISLIVFPNEERCMIHTGIISKGRHILFFSVSPPP